jgi:hypothetical protein
LRNIYFVVVTALLLSLAGCAKHTPIDKSSEVHFEDLDFFPQYARAYKDNINPRLSLLAVQNSYDKRYFEPWNYKQPPFECESILWPHRSYTYEKSYGENLRPLKKEWFDEMYTKGNYDEYGLLNKKAISLYYLNLRSFPTHKPVFKDPSRAGEGYPFDYLQNSGINANEPLFVSHLSSDGEWAYVFTSYATGWVPLRKISYIEDDIADKWQEARQIELTQDLYPIKDIKDGFVLKSRVGMRLPLISIEKTYYVALAITVGKNQSPIYTKVKIPFTVGREGYMKLNTDNFIQITDLMLQSKYGWGGLNEERDCSSMLRDLYAPFGLWLPRNSSEQSKVGKVISLEFLTEEQKKEKIIREAIPFETLLYKKGHILLYLGLYNGKIAVLHNAWGVKTKDERGEGRKIIGKTIISSLEIGKEFEDFDEEKGLLSQIISMNIVTQQ